MNANETRTVQITWVEAGTNNAAMIGLDETIESFDSIDEIREAAEYHAECGGYDLSKYECKVEEVK